MKKLNNKGFTLIEIVIVIVIIAILAAMLVPSLTQWIQKSKVKTFTSACGTIKTAVWAEEAEAYAAGQNATSGNYGSASSMFGESGTVTKEVGKTVAAGDADDVPSGGYAVTYNYANGDLAVYDASFKGVISKTAPNWTVTKANGDPLD